MSSVRKFVQQVFALNKIPWVFLVITAAALLIQCVPAWRGSLIYERAEITGGQWWRIWTGHIVHFGWPHFLADGGLFLLLGRVIEREHPFVSQISLLLMPVVIAAGIYLFDPSMHRYAGLSGVNVGLLVFLACKGWQKSWTDWFWPAVLGIHILEVVLEATQKHGVGGAMIRFDDPSVHVATSAHIAGAGFGIVLWAISVRKHVAREARIILDQIPNFLRSLGRKQIRTSSTEAPTNNKAPLQ